MNGRTGNGTDAAGPEPVAIVGMACRYPDADDPTQLWRMAIEQRQAFRELPPERLDVEDYFDRDRTAPDKFYSSMAALLEGWRFDRAAFRLPGTAHRATDPAHWLALETASRALEDAGYPGGRGKASDKTAVIIGNSLTGDVTRATALRLRWPYVRRVLAAAAGETALSGEQISALLERAESRYLKPFPPVGDETLAGGLSNTIAGRICNYFDFHGGGYTVDGACSSALLAIVTACRALVDRSADLVLAGGVDLSIDPFELVGFAKTGALAGDRMWVYDERSAGFIPGEGCGVVVLMRAADAHAAGLRVYAELIGWGVSSDGSGGITRPEQAGQLLALRRAYELAGVDPAGVRLIEGHGTGTAVGDETELAALATLLRGAREPAVVGSVKANIGHTKAASGAAGLIKAALSVASGVLPPTTGCERPHPLLRSAGVPLRTLSEPEPWPEGTRLAGVSSFGFGGINAHVTLRNAEAARSRVVATPRYQGRRPSPRHDVIALAGDNLVELRSTLDRLAVLAPRLSEAELHDVACQFGRMTTAGKYRVALVAESPRQLAERAAVGAAGLADTQPGRLTMADGVFLGNAGQGRVTLLLPGQGAPVRAGLGALGRQLAGSGDLRVPEAAADDAVGTAAAQPAIYRAAMAAIRWLARLGLTPLAAVGHSLGEIAGLVWAGSLSPEEADWLVRERGRVMGEFGQPGTGMVSVAADVATARDLCAGTRLVIAGYNGRSQVLAGPQTDVAEVSRRALRRGLSTVVLPVTHAFHSPAMADCVNEFKSCLQAVSFHPPGARLVSSVRGRSLTADDDIAALLSEQIIAPVRFWDAVTEVLPDTDLFCEAGPGRSLSALITAGCAVPVVSVDAGARDDRALAETAAALFAVGAVTLSPMFAGRWARPIDIWRDRVFVANPCSSVPPALDAREDPVSGGPTSATTTTAAGDDVAATVLGLVAEASELEMALIDPHARLLSDLHLTSLRVTQLVVSAAEATGRKHPTAPLASVDISVAELISAIEELAPADDSQENTLPVGLRPWIQCFVEERQRLLIRAKDAPARRWRVHVAPEAALSGEVRRVFGAEEADGRGEQADVMYVPDLAVPGAAAALLRAANSAIQSRMLVAVTHGSALSGFLKALRQEHPDVGVTLLRVPASGAGLRAAATHATVEPGVWRELVLDGEGDVARPRSRPHWRLGEDELPLGHSDVLLVSGGGKGIGYECAAAAARASGAALALLGRTRPDTDDVLRANLDRLREAGLRVAYEPVDVTDAVALASGVRRLADRVGEITTVLHASGVNKPMRFADLDEPAVEAHLAPKVTGLRNLLAALDTRRLRLLVTFGSVIGRYGLAGECHYALANGALRSEAERLAEELPDCRVLNVDWSIWAGAGMGEQLGVVDALSRLDVTPIPVAQGVDLFLGMLRTTSLPTTVAVHGRLGGLVHPETEELTGRFLVTPLVHYPRVELVAHADVDLTRDDYLLDHRIDGLAVLPAVVGMEAMAQAATALAGRPLRSMVDVALDHPVVVPDDGTRTIRVCALRQGDVIEVALRSDETGYRVDHFSATFPLAQPGELTVLPRPADEGVPLDKDDLYGPLYFHTGRFRLVEKFVALGAKHCQVRLSAPQGEQSYPVVLDAPLLGEPTSNDATVHALQACVPHRRLLPVGCERVTLVAGSGAPRELYAAERHAADGEYVWDVVGLDGFGARRITWSGLRLRDVGPMPAVASWPAPLLAVYLERSASELGLSSTLRVRMSGGMTLSTSGPGLTACDWKPVEQRSDEECRRLIGSRFATVANQLRTRLAEPDSTVATRIWSIAECLSKAGCPPDAAILVDGVYDRGWAKLRAGSVTVASAVVSADGVDVPVAVSILVGDPNTSDHEKDV